MLCSAAYNEHAAFLPKKSAGWGLTLPGTFYNALPHTITDSINGLPVMISTNCQTLVPFDQR